MRLLYIFVIYLSSYMFIIVLILINNNRINVFHTYLINILLLISIITIVITEAHVIEVPPRKAPACPEGQRKDQHGICRTPV
ncbi:hypothetical protein PUN28_008177 [Cardiocondyla obscurior]|uniref:Uncharacterized protein n=1 Tax=Cardiocondyla obscurior TaxID=286306 RepID=A0AAW2FZY4_9HYME